MDNKEIFLQMNNASFRYPSGEYLFENIKTSVKQGDKIALVGANGTGKSTLLRILTGGIQLEEGALICNKATYYLKQIDITLQQKNFKLYEYVTTLYENWWEVLDRAQKLFGTEYEPDLNVSSLSGGELMKLNLAAAAVHNPDILLMDEPTNHLDIQSVQTLISYLGTQKAAYIIVSHDTFFLDQVVNEIWELENKKITVYGGNYTFYKEQKALHLKGIQKRVAIAHEKLERANDLAQKEEEKRARKANSAKMAFIKGSMDKDRYQVGKNAASAGMSNKKIILDTLKETAEQELEELETEKRKLAFINMKNTSNNAGKTLVNVEHANLFVGNTELISDISIQLLYSDRIVFCGNNGSGKTTLIKGLLKTDPKIKLEGEVVINPSIVYVYVDQSYSIIKPDLNLLQNIMEFDKTVPEWKAKEQLGKFQFKSEMEMNKKGKDLSGGEMARLMMAMVTSYPIDLLVLDEPTNNLDVETIEVLEKALNSFVGTLIVVSHNMEFLNKINIKKGYIVKNKSLKLMMNNPSNRDAFYQELVAK